MTFIVVLGLFPLLTYFSPPHSGPFFISNTFQMYAHWVRVCRGFRSASLFLGFVDDKFCTMIDVYLWPVYIMHRLHALLAHKNTFLSSCGSNKLHDIHHCPRAFAGLTCVSPPHSGPFLSAIRYGGRVCHDFRSEFHPFFLKSANKIWTIIDVFLWSVIYHTSSAIFTCKKVFFVRWKKNKCMTYTVLGLSPYLFWSPPFWTFLISNVLDKIAPWVKSIHGFRSVNPPLIPGICWSMTNAFSWLIINHPSALLFTQKNCVSHTLEANNPWYTLS